MNKITPKEAIANLNQIYGMVSPDIQRSLDVAFKCMEERPQGDCISRNAVIRMFNTMDRYRADKLILQDTDEEFPKNEVFIVDDCYEQLDLIDNAPTVEPRDSFDLGYIKGLEDAKWYDHIPNCLKARHGEYVLYKVDFLLDNLAREVNIMESARRMKGGAK